MVNQHEVIESLPRHLRPFVTVQDYSRYSPRDQAVWRFLLYQLKKNLSQTAHPVYLQGLAGTGISLEHIPAIDEMNHCLGKLGWRAVAVNGFIPPIVFMELQALRVLAIATEMRSLQHMLYTPAPDIVHESAGHAPFIIDEDYSEFLQQFGRFGMRAIASREDIDLYEAVRHLSIVKESGCVNAGELADAERRLRDAMAALKEPSEAALLARLQWWIIEYGLVGPMNDYRIFGAGLLSSLGESVNCLDDARVRKIPLTVNAVATTYDITREQPQLFVARNCRHLSQVLREFGRQMSVHRGGLEGLQRALKAHTVNTAALNSGIEISGRFVEVREDAVGNPVYVKTRGPTQLAYRGEQLPGHGIDYHRDGFGSPLGAVLGMSRCLSAYTVDELREHGVAVGQVVELEFVSGICVCGKLKGLLRRDQKNLILTFVSCRVTDVEGRILFDPEWGDYDMAVGEEVTSVYGGSSDPLNFPLYSAPMEEAAEPALVDQCERELLECYARVRTLRERDSVDSGEVQRILAHARELPEREWLLEFELLELAQLNACSDDHTRWFEDRLRGRLRTAASEEQRLVSYALERLGCWSLR